MLAAAAVYGISSEKRKVLFVITSLPNETACTWQIQFLYFPREKTESFFHFEF